MTVLHEIVDSLDAFFGIYLVAVGRPRGVPLWLSPL